MKKTYEKPTAYIQDMSVNSFVAGACTSAGANVLNYGESDCTYTDPENYVTFFSSNCQTTDGWGVDIVNPNDTSPYAQLCYHRPLDIFTFFNS